MTDKTILQIAAEMVKDDARHPGMCELLVILDALGVTEFLGIAGMADLVVMLQMQREKKGLHLVSPSPLAFAKHEVEEMYHLAHSRPRDVEVIRIRKGLPVGKSTEVGAEHLRKQETLRERAVREKKERLTFSLGDKLKEKLR